MDCYLQDRWSPGKSRDKEKTCKSLTIFQPVNTGCFPFNQNVQFDFSSTSISEWNSIFQDFQKEDNLARYTQIFQKNFPRSFLSIIKLFSQNFWNFWLKGSHFRNSTVSGITGKFSRKFLYHLLLFPNFRKFWLNGKHCHNVHWYPLSDWETHR